MRFAHTAAVALGLALLWPFEGAARGSAGAPPGERRARPTRFVCDGPKCPAEWRTPARADVALEPVQRSEPGEPIRRLEVEVEGSPEQTPVKHLEIELED